MTQSNCHKWQPLFLEYIFQDERKLQNLLIHFCWFLIKHLLTLNPVATQTPTGFLLANAASTIILPALSGLFLTDFHTGASVYPKISLRLGSSLQQFLYQLIFFPSIYMSQLFQSFYSYEHHIKHYISLYMLDWLT